MAIDGIIQDNYSSLLYGLDLNFACFNIAQIYLLISLKQIMTQTSHFLQIQ